MEHDVFDLSVKAATAGNNALAETYRFLAAVLRPRVESLSTIASSNNPFWTTPASLSDDEVQLLANLSESVRDPELRARFADFLWLRTGDRTYAEAAVIDYLASAKRLRDPDKWPGCVGRYDRAVAVAASLGKKNVLYVQAIETVEQYLAELDGTDPLFLSARLMSILLDQKQGDRARYVALADKCARAAEERGRFDLALHYWNVKLRWLKALNDRAGEREARIEAADSVIKDAESHTVGENASFLAASSLLQNAIAMLQKAGASKKRIGQLAAQLKKYESRGKGEMKSLRGPRINAAEMMNDARSAVAGAPLDEAIVTFVDLLHLRSRDTVRAEVLRRAKMFPFTHLFPEVTLNQGGAAIAARASVRGDEEEETDNVLALCIRMPSPISACRRR